MSSSSITDSKKCAESHSQTCKELTQKRITQLRREGYYYSGAAAVGIIATIALLVTMFILSKFSATWSNYYLLIIPIIPSAFGTGILIARAHARFKCSSELQKEVSESQSNEKPPLVEPYTLDFCAGEESHDTVHDPAIVNWEKHQWEALVAKASQTRHLCITLGDEAAWRGLANHLHLFTSLNKLHINDLVENPPEGAINDLAESVAKREISVRISSCYSQASHNAAEVTSRKGNWYGPGGRGSSEYTCVHRTPHQHQIALYPYSARNR